MTATVQPVARPVTLTDFLLARIAEDEATFGPEPWLDPVGSVEEWSAAAGNRVLADCEVKRRIVERYPNASPDGDDWAEVAWYVLAALAAVYSDHPDYSAEWTA